MPNDVLMFRKSGFSIAMGNSSDEVKGQAERSDRKQRGRRLRQGGAEIRAPFGRYMMRHDDEPQRLRAQPIAHQIVEPVIVIVMGVSGSGKSTVAALLAAALGSRLQEGDDLHPVEDVEKMHSGVPLTDADRLPWLRKIAEKKSMTGARPANPACLPVRR